VLMSGIAITFERTEDGPASGREMCLRCCQLFLLDSAVPVVLAIGERLGFLCTSCLSTEERRAFTAACKRFNEDVDD
jgi:hypothetical protein